MYAKIVDTLIQINCNTYIAMNGTWIVTLTGIILFLCIVIHSSSQQSSKFLFSDSTTENELYCFIVAEILLNTNDLIMYSHLFWMTHIHIQKMSERNVRTMNGEQFDS